MIIILFYQTSPGDVMAWTYHPHYYLFVPGIYQYSEASRISDFLFVRLDKLLDKQSSIQ